MKQEQLQYCYLFTYSPPQMKPRKLGYIKTLDTTLFTQFKLSASVA